MQKRWALLLAALLSGIAQAQDGCAGFGSQYAHELSLFQTEAAPLVAGHDAGSAPLLEPDRLYELRLAPQAQLSFAAKPGKTMLADGASAGLVRMRVPSAGRYRVAISGAYWIDVVDAGKPIVSVDFLGRQGCDQPHKIVIYDLPAQRELVLQLSGGIGERVRLAVTSDARTAQ
jgi:hypothetical protein